MGIKLGNGKWATKEDELLAYRVIEGKYFNRSFDFARSSTTTRVNKDGYIEFVPSDTARIDFTDSVDGALLTEPASTNLITYPISFADDYWTKSGATIGVANGSELVPNGDFATDTDWTKGTGWTISGGSANANTVGSYVNLQTNNRVIEVQTIYDVSFEVSNYVQGSVRLAFTGSVATPEASANGTYTARLRSGATSRSLVYIQGITSFIGSVDNVSVKEVQGFEAPKALPIGTGSDVMSGWDFTNGWVISGSGTIDSANTITITGGGIKKNSLLTTNTYYKCRIAGTTTVEDINIRSYSPGSQYSDDIPGKGTFDTEFHFQAVDSGIYIRTNGGTTTITTLEIKEITPDSWSGGGFERDAYKLVEDTSSGTHNIKAISVLSATTNYTLSVYAKAEEREWLALSDNISSVVYFDLANGVPQISSVYLGANDYGIEPLANGWYRCWMNVTTVGVGNFGIYVADSYGGTTYTGDGTSGLYIAYAQLEEQASATSLMLPTTEGSTTSRVADACNGSGTAQDFKDYNASGVLYAEVAANSDDLTDRFLSISDGTSVNRINIGYSNTSNLIFALGYVSNSNQFLMAYTLTDITDFHKVAVRYTENDFSFWIDGVEVATDTSGSTFSASTLSECALNVGGGGSNFYGKTKALGVFDYLSDDEMETLTT